MIYNLFFNKKGNNFLLLCPIIDQRIFHRMRSGGWRICFKHSADGTILPMDRAAHRGQPAQLQKIAQSQSKVMDTTHLPKSVTISYSSILRNKYWNRMIQYIVNYHAHLYRFCLLLRRMELQHRKPTLWKQILWPEKRCSTSGIKKIRTRLMSSVSRSIRYFWPSIRPRWITSALMLKDTSSKYCAPFLGRNWTLG